jgi:hypothetical protein
MILGHNWGAVHEFADAHRVGSDPMNGPTWRCLQLYLESANVCTIDCFFTNIFVGLQPDRSQGRMNASEEFKTQCRAFLFKQIDIVKPRLVAILGQDAANQYHQSGCPTPSVDLRHPGWVCAGYNAGTCDLNVAEAAARLRGALDDLNRK